MATHELLENLVKALNSGENPGSPLKIVSQGIVDGTLKLLDFIEALGPLLLSPEAGKRSSAVDAVSNVISRCHSKFSGDEKRLLTEFFCSKLKDHHSILPASLKGLLALSDGPDLPAGVPQDILRAIFENVYCQSQVVSDRRVVFHIFKNLLTNHLKEIQSMGADFVYGFIQAVDQEKDPRNLLLIFSCFPIIVSYCNLGAFVEELFEVVSCYFPVDFTPPASDPFGVTKEDLVLGLRNCLSCSKLFAPYCLPLLQEKLDSDVVSAKVDALQTLESCCAVYGPTELEGFLVSLWNSLRREVFMSLNADEVEHSALDCLTAVARVFTHEGKIHSMVFMKLLEQIIQECKKHLCEPEHRLMFPSCNVLVALMAGSSHASHLIIHEIIPTLLHQFETKTLSTQRNQIISIMNKIVHAGLYGVTEHFVGSSSVNQYADSLYTVYLSCVNSDMENRTRILALQGLVNFTHSKLKFDQWPSLCDYLLHSLTQQQLDHQLREEMKMLLKAIATSSEALAVTRIIPNLISTLETGVFSMNPALDTLSALPATKDILFNTIPHVVHLLRKSSSDVIEAAVLPALLNMMQNAAAADALDDLDLLKDLLQIMEDPGHKLANLHLAAKVLRILAANLNQSAAETLARDFIRDFSSWDCTANPNLVLVLEATLGWLQVQIPMEELALLISVLQKLAVEGPISDARVSAARLVAALVNKAPEGAGFDVAMEMLLKSLEANMEVNAANGAVLFVWITKGLVMRGYANSDTWIDRLVSYLDRETTSAVIAEGFGIILEDSAEILNAESHAYIRLLYRQRFFQQTLPKLLSAYQAGRSSSSAHFSALANQLHWLPKTILGSHLPTLLPILVQCLTPQHEVRLLEATLNAITGLIADSPHFITKFIDTLVPRLLNLAGTSEFMKVRMLALKCLGSVTSAGEQELLPLRSSVVQQLAPCLDDKKRLVRKEAAIARNKWIVLGQPCGK